LIRRPGIISNSSCVSVSCDLGVAEMTFCRVIKTGKARQYNMDAWDAESIIRLETMFDDVAGESRIKIHTGLPFRLSVSPDNQRAPFYMKYGNRCDAGIRGLYVAPLGDVYPCELLAQEKYKLGNLLSDEWPEFLRSSPVLSFLRTLQSPESCMDCNYFHICRGGCPGLQAEDETKLALPMLHCPFANSSRKRTELEREREK